MRGWTVGAVVTAVCAGVFVLPGAAFAADKPDGQPEIGPCKTKVDKVEDRANKKTSAQKKAEKEGKAMRGGNDRGLTTGVFVICK